MTIQDRSTIANALPGLSFGWPEATSLPEKSPDEIKARFKSDLSLENWVVIDDIKDLDLVINKEQVKKEPYASQNFFSLIGVTPTPTLTTSFVQKLLISTFLSIVTSIWVPNVLLLSTFFVFNIFDFLTSLVWERKKDFRLKLSHFVASFFLVGVATLTEAMVGTYPISFTPLTFSILGIVLFFMNINLIWILTKRIGPYTPLARSGRLNVVYRAGIHACREFVNFMEKEFENNLLRPDEKKKKQR